VKPLARQNQLFVEELVGECVVYDSDRKKAHSLNSTVTWIWRHCDGATTVEDLSLHFEREFGCSDSLDLIFSGIQQLEAANLLVSSTPRQTTSSIPAAGPVMSRRAVVAAGSALVPVIASILVPTAASAQSGQNGQSGQQGGNGGRGGQGGQGGQQGQR
jgi:hypothetical protein